MTRVRNAFLTVRWLPSVQPVRFSRRVNIQRPRPPHYEKARLIDVCKPMFARKTEVAPMYELCQKSVDKWNKEEFTLENPYFRFLARDFMNCMNHSKMIAFLHSNSITAYDKFKVITALKKQNMYMNIYNRKIVNLAVENTNYEAIMPLFESHTAIVFSPEVQVKKLLQILKKAPQLVLMAGIVDGEQLSRTDLVKYSQLQDLPTTQASLVSVINMLGSQLVNSLNAHQQTLVRHLDQHIELQQKPMEDPHKAPVNGTGE